MFLLSLITATTWYGSFRRLGLFVIARIVLMTWESGSSDSGGRTMMDREPWGLTISRSARSIGLPVLHTTFVFFVEPTRPRISSSISTLSFSASTAMQAPFLRFSFAVVSSLMIVKIWGDQPRMTVWSCSTTNERPLRSSSTFCSIPLVRTPMRVLTTKTPPRVMTNIEMRKGQLPESPPIVPASSVRMSPIQAIWTKPSFAPSSADGAMFVRSTTADTAAIRIRERTKSQRMSAMAPFDIVLSKK
jgi:hypothetical protein